jgi:hypothetical protein
MWPSFIRRPRQRQVLDEHVALADLEGLGLEVLVHAALVQRVRVEEPGLRVERGVRPVLAAPRRRPVLGGLHVADALGDLGLDRPTGLIVDVARPVHLLERICRQQLAVGAVDHVEKAVAVELHDHLALLAANIDVGVDQLPAGVVVVGIVGRELVVPDDLAGRRPRGQHR